MEFRYQDGQETHTVRVSEQADGFEVSIGERRYRVTAREVDGSTLDLTVDGRFARARHAAQGDARWVAVEGSVAQATQVRQRRQRRAAGGGEGTLASTMPGQIVAVLVAAGETVERGQTLVVMEAMKMELRVAAPLAGTVARVLVAPGEAVERGQTLVEMREAAVS